MSTSCWYINVFIFIYAKIFIFLDQCKSRKQDIKIREEILEYLQNKFGKCYPSSSVHIYGSSENGFGFRESDLDISIVLKDNVCFFLFVFFYNLLLNFNCRMMNQI